MKNAKAEEEDRGEGHERARHISLSPGLNEGHGRCVSLGSIGVDDLLVDLEESNHSVGHDERGKDGTGDEHSSGQSGREVGRNASKHGSGEDEANLHVLHAIIDESEALDGRSGRNFLANDIVSKSHV